MSLSLTRVVLPAPPFVLPGSDVSPALWPPPVAFGPGRTSPWVAIRNPLPPIPDPGLVVPLEPVQVPDRPVFPPQVLTGPPLQGAPWFKPRPIFSTSPQQTIYEVDRKPYIERTAESISATGQDRIRRITEKLSELANSLLRQGYLHKVSRSEYALIGGAFTATRAPNKLDDASIGAVVGAPWVNTTTNAIYFCISNTAGNAVWNGPY